jgi:phospholipid/cholesterol/gamma-HCH transport system substrate-binding protein
MSQSRMLATFGFRRMNPRPFVGALGMVAAAAIVWTAVTLYQNGFTGTVPVIVNAPRAGLVMNPDAKVQMRGVQVGRVTSIDVDANGQARLMLAIDPAQLHNIPSNVDVDITSSTAFGAKFVEMSPPLDPSPEPLRAGQVLDSPHVTVEFNTIFSRLQALLQQLEPFKVRETLNAMSTGLAGHGDQFGQLISDARDALATVHPALPALGREMQGLPIALNAYADAAPDLLRILDNTTTVGQTVVDQDRNLDALLVSTIGLAGLGNDVLTANRHDLTDVLHLLVPTSTLFDQYNAGLTCALRGVADVAKIPPFPDPGIVFNAGFQLGLDRYRYPQDLPKVAATGGPFCVDTPPGGNPPFVVTDDGANPFKYGNQGIVLNSDGLKQFLFGPIDGPPRNSMQTGQPG